MNDPMSATSLEEIPAALADLSHALHGIADRSPDVSTVDLHLAFYRVGEAGCRPSSPDERGRAGRLLATLAPGQSRRIGERERAVRLKTGSPVLATLRSACGGRPPRHDLELVAVLERSTGDAERADPLLAVEACSPSLAPDLARLRRVAGSPLPVLIRGETGTGKEVVARAVHRASGRPGRFVAENCAALADNLLEAELFGARRGAFTGADHDRHGLLEEANGGTLLLDEIAEMPHRLQVKLLRALQEREVRPVGASRPVPFDARLLAATNRPGSAAGTLSGLRSDLYYRLAAVELVLPPLRRRRSDLPWLAAALLSRAARDGIGPGHRLSEPALEALYAHRFPGNVRELDNALRQAAALAPGPAILPEGLRGALGPASPEPWEAQLIRDALDASSGVKSAAARRLGWTRQKLYRRLRALGMQDAVASLDRGRPLAQP